MKQPAPSRNCPQCHAPLPADAPQGLCPGCLLAAVALPTEAGPAPERAAPPSLAEVAASFPQLEILELIGRGGMGVVYKARQKSLNRLVALKLLAPERVTDPGFADRFAREAQALARLNHPNIVTIHDFGTTAPPHSQLPIAHAPFFYLLMEFVDGVNLRQAMRAGRFTPEQALAIVPPVCEALQYAHDHGIVHRDIKPENLLLDKTGRIKIADFGIAKMLSEGDTLVPATPLPPLPAGATLLGDKSVPLTAAGTPHYMAPEQRDHHRTDHRADIYSLGVVLYELLTGELPGAQLQPPSRKVQIDVRLDEVVLRALETKPELRFQTAGEFRTQLETIATPGTSRREEASFPSAPPPLLKTSPTYVSTPEWLASARGKFWVYTGKGTLVLTADQLALTDAQTGATTTIPLAAIRDVSLGNYPWVAKPAALHYVSVTWEANGQTHCRYFNPNQGWFCPVWETNPIVLDWHQALRAAVTAATGKAPAETPTSPHRPNVGEIALMGLMFGMPVFVIGAAFFAMKSVIASAHGRVAQPTNWLLPGLALFAAVIPFLVLLLLSRRSHQTSGTPPSPPHQPGPGTSIWTVLLFSLPFAFITIFFFSASQSVAPPAPVQPTTEFIVSLLGLGVVVPFLTLYLLPRWGRPRDVSQSPNAPRKLSLWPSVALSAFCAPLLVHLLMLPAGKVPPEPTHAVVRLVFSFPGALLLAALAGAGLWLRHRREPPPAVPGARPPQLGYGLALLCLPLLIHLMMLPAQLLLPEPARRGAPFPIGIPEAIILAVLGVVGLIRLRQPPAVAKSPGRNLLGLGLICFGMFLGGMKIQETYRDHSQRVNALTFRIPSLQQNWIAAGNEVFAANTELSRHIAQEPLARTDAERQRFLIEQGRLEGEVSKAKVRQDIINGQIRTTQDSIDALRFPTAADFVFVLKWSLPFILAGLLVLTWRGSSRREEAPSGRFQHAGLLMLAMPVLLLAFLFLQFSGKAPALFGSAPAVAITNVAHTVMGSSNTVLFTELEFRVEGTEPVELRVEFTGPELPGPVARALAQESPDHGRLFASLHAREHNALLLQPEPSAAAQPRVHFQPGTHKWQIGFALPTERATWQARGNFRPPVTRLAPSSKGEHAWEFFAVSSDHQPRGLATYTARIVAKRSAFAATAGNSGDPGVTRLNFTPVGVSNHVVIVDMTAEVGRGHAELRPVLEGPPLSREADAALADTFFPPFNGDFIKPTPHAGNQPFRILKEGRHTQRLGFVLPDAALAQTAAANLRPIGPLPAVAGRTFAGTLFEVRQTNGQTYGASLQVGPPLTAADPGWVSVSTITQHNETSAKLTWEILASQPGTAQFRREKNYASASLQRDPKSKLHRVTASVELTRVSLTRVRLVVKKGYSTSAEELTGNFRELADELLRSINFSTKTTRGTPIELCRVQGKPLTVTVDAAPPSPAATRASASGKSSHNTPPTYMTAYMRLGLIAAGVIVIGFGGVALLVWLLRKGGASNRTVLLVLAVPFVLLALAVAALIGWKVTGGMRLEKFERMQLHANHTGPLSAEPPGRVQQTQNGFRLQLPAGQLATFEVLIRQTDDSLKPVPALTALVATSTNAGFNDTLYWTLRRAEAARSADLTNQLWFWSVTAHDGHGRALAQRTDHGTNFSHALASGDTLDWWQLALPGTVTFGAGETKDLSLFRTCGTATVRGTHPTEAVLRVRCAATPTGFVTNGTPRIELGLAAQALLEQGVPTLPSSPDVRIPRRPGSSSSVQIERVQGTATNGLESEWRIASAKPGWMWLKGGGEKAIGQQMLLNPADGQYHGGVVVRLEKSTGHQKGPEVRARLGYGFAGMSTPWGAVTSALAFDEGAAAFRQHLAKGSKPPVAISSGQEFELLRLDDAVVTVAVTDDVSTTPTRATSPSNDPATGSRQQKLRAIALENAAQAFRTGERYILHETGKTPRERTHDPETGYPILVLPVGDPEADALFNEAMRAHFRDQKAAKAEAKAITSMQFKVLRVENPPGTRHILLHFERDTNPALGLEVWQDVTPSPALHKQPQPGTYLDSQMKTWLGVNHARVLRWTLPNEFTEAEVRAVVKDIEQRAKVWRALDEGHVLGVATVTHRDGWKYHLVATVKRTPK